MHLCFTCTICMDLTEPPPCFNILCTVISAYFRSKNRSRGGAGHRMLSKAQDEMRALLARFFGAYCLKKVRHDSTVLHYRRTPTWRSLVLFVGEWSNFTTTAITAPRLKGPAMWDCTVTDIIHWRKTGLTLLCYANLVAQFLHVANGTWNEVIVSSLPGMFAAVTIRSMSHCDEQQIVLCCLMCTYLSLISRPSGPPIFDCFKRLKTGGHGDSRFYLHTLQCR